MLKITAKTVAATRVMDPNTGIIVNGDTVPVVFSTFLQTPNVIVSIGETEYMFDKQELLAAVQSMTVKG